MCKSKNLIPGKLFPELVEIWYLYYLKLKISTDINILTAVIS